MYNHIKILAREFIYYKEVFSKEMFKFLCWKMENLGIVVIQSVAHFLTIVPLIDINCFYIVVKPKGQTCFPFVYV